MQHLRRTDLQPVVMPRLLYTKSPPPLPSSQPVKSTRNIGNRETRTPRGKRMPVRCCCAERIYDESNVASVSVKYTRAIAYKQPTGAINTFPLLPSPSTLCFRCDRVVSLRDRVHRQNPDRTPDPHSLSLSRHICFALFSRFPSRRRDQFSARYFARWFTLMHLPHSWTVSDVYAHWAQSTIFLNPPPRRISKLIYTANRVRTWTRPFFPCYIVPIHGVFI